MARVLLGVTGSVAALRTPALAQQLRADGHEVKVVATAAALYFFDPAEVTAAAPGTLVLDEDEWPGRSEGRRYRRDDRVLHIELRRWAELLLIAPLDANTLAKLAAGLSDNCLTCVWRAWDPARPVVLAPAMNTLMWDNPLTHLHFRQLLGVFAGRTRPASPESGERFDPESTTPEAVIERLNGLGRLLRVVPPATRRLACGDVGAGALAAFEDISAAVRAMLPPARPAESV